MAPSPVPKLEDQPSQVRQIHLEDVWESWQEEEGESWRRGGVGGKLGGVTPGDASMGHTPESLGLLRYSHTVHFIHSYFSNLEARKCCLNLAGGKTSFTNMRVVQQISAEEDVVNSEPTVLGPQSSIRIETDVDKLTKEELLIYKKAVYCTQFPVLSAPDPPPVTSPTLTPMPRPKSSTLSESLSLTSDPGTFAAEMEYSMIPAELLCDWLRQVFGLSKSAAAQYETLFRNGTKRKSYAKILVEELMGQLNMLETNTHPYYHPNHFVSRHGYDLWQQQQRGHIGELISKFWHLSLPSVRGIQQSQDVVLHHHHYRALLHKMLSYEKVCCGGGRRPSHKHSQGTTLTSASQRILQEFALRYGVGKLFRKICYLEYLADHFENDEEIIAHMVDVITSIIQLLSVSKSKVVMVQSEYKTLSKCVGLLFGQCENSLTRVKRLFTESTAVQGVAGLISLLDKVVHLKGYLEGQKQTPLSQLLLKYLKSNFCTAYERHKIIACSELKMAPRSAPISPKLVNRLLSNIKDEVEDYRVHYYAAFCDHFDAAHEAAQCFYDLLMRDVLLLCDLGQSSEKVASGLNLCMVGLLYRLHRLDQEWDQYIATEQQVWRTAFEGRLHSWLRTMHRHSEKLLKQAVGEDDYAVMFSGIMVSRSRDVEGRCQSTTSTVSLTPSAHSAFSAVPSSSALHAMALEQSHESFLTSDSIFKPLQDASESLLPKAKVPKDAKQTCDDKTAVKDLLTFKADKQVSKSPSLPSVSGLEDDAAGISVDVEHQMVGFKESAASRSDSESPSLPGGLDIGYFAHGDSIGSDAICKLHAVEPHERKNGDPLKLEQSPVKILTEESQPPGGANDRHSPGENDGTKPVPDDETITLSVDSGAQNSKICDKAGLTRQTNEILFEGAPFAEDPTQHHTCPHPPLENLSTSWQSASSSFRNDLLNSASFSIGKEGEATGGKDCPKSAVQETVISDASFGSSPNRLAPFQITSVEADLEEMNQFLPKLLPVSGSVLDLLCILQRLASFSQIMCNTVFSLLPLQHREKTPTQESDNDSHGSKNGVAGRGSKSNVGQSSSDQTSNSKDDLQETKFAQGQGHSHQSPSRSPTQTTSETEDVIKVRARARLKVIRILMKIQSDLAHMYADNILCMDLCGMKNSDAIETVGRQLVRDIKASHKAGKVWGCRHLHLGTYDCTHYLNKKAKYLADKFEPVVQEMCIRVNNVSDLISLLGSVISASQSQLQKDEVVRICGDDAELEDRPSTDCKRHLQAVRVAQLKLMAYRINLFFKETLMLLLSHELSSLNIETRLAPLTQFLDNYTAMLKYWLYRENYSMLLHYLWTAIAKSFEKKMQSLSQLHGTAGQQAEVLLQAIAHFLKFMYRAGSDLGVTLDFLTKQVEKATYLLQLYTVPTPKLTTAFRHLSQMELDDDLSHGLSDLESDFPHRSYLQAMQSELHATRKCFTGRALVDWLLRHSESFTDTQNTDPQKETASKTAQKLLNIGIIIEVEDTSRARQGSRVTVDTATTPASSNGQATDPYPELLYCGTPSISFQFSGGGSLPLSSASSSESLRSLPAVLQRARETESGSTDTLKEDKGTSASEADDNIAQNSDAVNDSGYETVGAKLPTATDGSRWKTESLGFPTGAEVTVAPVVQQSHSLPKGTTFHDIETSTPRKTRSRAAAPPSMSSSSYTECTTATVQDKVAFQDSRRFFYRFASIVEDTDDTGFQDDVSLAEESDAGEIQGTTSGSHAASHMTSHGASHVTNQSHMSTHMTALYADTYKEKGVTPRFLLDIMRTRRKTDPLARQFLAELPLVMRQKYSLPMPKMSSLCFAL